MSQSVFGAILWNLLKMCTTSSKFLETTPSVNLDKFEDQWSDASLQMTQFGKHGTFREFF